ncbi:formate dehydrogenase subunit delta [Maricaulis sp.]|uniref:formate dehydrogenase subunit delta n=1 Tax=Maricaulis sp. TaxID=1486257 RepID=UPI00262F4ECE|nr:formate dehydrogenase subunit delta [Maricaulis sp.]
MNQPELVRMANQIAEFFQPYSEAEAVDGVEAHLRNFWDPRMRAGLIEIFTTQPDQLKPAVQAAIQRLR